MGEDSPRFNAPKSKKSRKAISLNIRLSSATQVTECADATFQFQTSIGNDFQYFCDCASSWGLSGKYYYQFGDFKPVPSFITASQISQLRELILSKLGTPSLKELSAKEILLNRIYFNKIQNSNACNPINIPEIQEYLNFIDSKTHVAMKTITLEEFKKLSKDQYNLCSIFSDIGLTPENIEFNSSNQLALIDTLTPGNHAPLQIVPEEWAKYFQISKISEDLSKHWSFEGTPSSSGEILKITLTLPSQEGEPKIVISSNSPNPYLLPWKISVYPPPSSSSLTSSSSSSNIYPDSVPQTSEPIVEFMSYSIKIPQYLSTMFSSICGPMWFEENLWKNSMWKIVASDLKKEIHNFYK